MNAREILLNLSDLFNYNISLEKVTHVSADQYDDIIDAFLELNSNLNTILNQCKQSKENTDPIENMAYAMIKLNEEYIYRWTRLKAKSLGIGKFSFFDMLKTQGDIKELTKIRQEYGRVLNNYKISLRP